MACASTKVKVKFYASLREEIGIEEIVLELLNPTFSALINALKNTIKSKSNAIVDSKGEIRSDIMISVNNKLINRLNLGKLNFEDGDIIDIMPLPSGG